MRFAWLIALAVVAASPAIAGDDSAELAQKLSNPVAKLISLPFQFNDDCCFGPRDGGRVLLNIQPVIPIPLNDDMTVIVRTIMPVIGQDETVPRAGSHIGFGDITQSFFFSPTPEPGGWIWGAGPVFLWPSASDAAIGNREWGAGPTLVILKQESGWTYGALINHIWSYAGESKRDNISSTFVQPFVSYTWPDTTGVGFSTETTYDWIHDQWSTPLNLSVSHIYKLAGHPTSFSVGGRWYPATFDDGPRWGLRFNVTFLFPE